MKKIIVCILLVALVFVFPVAKAEETVPASWNYDNSFIVRVASERNDGSFTPADFPEVPCVSVIPVGKELMDDGRYYYELILVLDKTDEEQTQAAMETVKSNRLLMFRPEPNEYAYAGKLTLNYKKVYLPKGGYVDLRVADMRCNAMDGRHTGIRFGVDTGVITPDGFDMHRFEEYGIVHFRNCEKLSWSSSSPEGVYNPSGYYYGLLNEETPLAYEADDYLDSQVFVDTMAVLCKQPWIKHVELFSEWEVGGVPSHETWQVEENGILTLTMTDPIEENPYPWQEDYSRTYYRAARITGKEVGTQVVNAKYNWPNPPVTAQCTVVVYDETNTPGDVNGDGKTDAKDALAVLVRAVTKMPWTEEEIARMDINQDGVGNAEDALCLLKVAVKKPFAAEQ